MTAPQTSRLPGNASRHRAGLATVVLAACSLWCWNPLGADTGEDAAASSAAAVEVVHRFVGAFNAQDVEAMLALAAVDIRWMSVSGGELTVEAAGREALRAAMTEYFEGLASARSELLWTRQSGPFVQTVERASWTTDSVGRSQCSPAVYEVAEGRIRNVWYFPAYECP